MNRPKAGEYVANCGHTDRLGQLYEARAPGVIHDKQTDKMLKVGWLAVYHNCLKAAKNIPSDVPIRDVKQWVPGVEEIR